MSRLFNCLGNLTVLAAGAVTVISATACSNVTNDCNIMSRCPEEDAGHTGGTRAGGTSTGGSTVGGVGSSITSGMGGSSAGNGGTSGGGTGGNNAGGMATGGNAATGVGGMATGGMAAGGSGGSSLDSTGGVSTGGVASACNPTCGGTKPVCNESAATCVECMGDDSCSGAKPACNGATNTCVACMNASHCSGTTPACNSATNRCVPCISDGNCSGGTPACDTDTSVCVRCTKNDHCSGATPVCDTAEHTCVECLSDTNCTTAKPACKTAAATDAGAGPVTGLNTCVQCTTHDDCSGNNSLCDETRNVCVECLTNNDCSSASASLCIAGTCSPCVANSDCAHVSGKGVCKLSAASEIDAGADVDAGASTNECVQCTVENETPCNGKSCNPVANTCTATTKNSVGVCHPCVADSECIDDVAASVHPSSRCVSMKFKGAERGSYCLPRGANGCSNPYQVPVYGAASLSGAAPEDYCGINQAATTCEALLDLSTSKSCSGDTVCGIGQGDGLCKTVGLNPNHCTIPCGADSQCLSGFTCSSTSNGYCH